MTLLNAVDNFGPVLLFLRESDYFSGVLDIVVAVAVAVASNCRLSLSSVVIVVSIVVSPAVFVASLTQENQEVLLGKGDKVLEEGRKISAAHKIVNFKV